MNATTIHTMHNKLLLPITKTPVKQPQAIKIYDIRRLWHARYILNKYPERRHTLAALCREVGLNEFKLKKGFKELFGITVFGYLLHRRMEHAKKMLLESSGSITDIAENCGYTYVQSFSTAFKKLYGTTPEKFRQEG